MSPNATTIEQEGVYMDNFKLVDRGRFREKELMEALTGAKYPARNPIQNVNDAAIVSANPVQAAQVKSAIMVAGTSLGWQMTEVRPGLIQGTLNLRKHTAVVDIPYSTTKYSIVYKSSVNLDERDGQIHKNYNSWVQNLSKKIGTELLRP